MKKILLIVFLFILIGASVVGGVFVDRFLATKFLDKYFTPAKQDLVLTDLDSKTSVVSVVKKVGPSVVSVSAKTPKRRVINFSPFGGFGSRIEGGNDQDIGSGFIVSSDGLIVTNKHVVSDTSLTYQVVTNDGKNHEVKSISRDPNNDIAVLKIDEKNLTPVELGDSGNLEVGQFVIAIGTALGEFRNTVTTGVVSGLGRGISAGDQFGGYVEKIDNVIQTDAAINPGNSGGPLLNSLGQVIGINVAVASGAQNIAFSIPVNTVKDALNSYKANGKFPSKAYLGIEYQMISKAAALLNNVPSGALVANVRANSPAEKAGIFEGDLIYKIDGKEVTDLGKMIADKKSGDNVKIELWRDPPDGEAGGETKELQVTLSEFSE